MKCVVGKALIDRITKGGSPIILVYYYEPFTTGSLGQQSIALLNVVESYGQPTHTVL